MGNSLIQRIAIHQPRMAMPWDETQPVDERERFIEAHHARLYTMTELCYRFGISRKTGYKWVKRFREGGKPALADRSRAPRSCPHKTPPEIEKFIVDKRKANPDMGAPMIIDRLSLDHPEIEFPAYSTGGDILKRHGLIKPKPQRRKKTQHERVPLVAEAPNQVWGLDYKGEFRLGNTRYCYPLTASDQYSRFVITVRSHTAVSGQQTILDMEVAFHKYGLPDAIRTDNGVPFATHGMLGLSRLGVWFIKLGIEHQRIAPGQPWQNPRHERMHRTLKAATTRPPEADHTAQQHRFDVFVEDFNHHRPHQGISRVPPATLHHKSHRDMPAHLPEPDYPGHFEVRRVSNSGEFRLRGNKYTLSQALALEPIGLEEVDDSIWSIYFFDTLLGRLDEQTKRII